MRFYDFSILLIIALSIAISNAGPRNRIVYGDLAAPKEFPWMLRLGGDGMCGASLLKLSPNDTESNVVLTAAHCVGKCMEEDKPCCVTPVPDSFYVRYGSLELDNGTKVSVIRIHTYSDSRYAPGTQDIAVLKLKEKIKFTDVVAGVRIPDTDGAEPSLGHKCVLSGWGRTEKDQISQDLMKKEFEIVDPCEVWPKHPGRFCGRADRIRSPACAGDSGSPGVCQNDDGEWIQYGVLIGGRDAVGEGCANFKTAGFTRVSGYLNWIHESAKGDTDSCP